MPGLHPSTHKATWGEGGSADAGPAPPALFAALCNACKQARTHARTHRRTDVHHVVGLQGAKLTLAQHLGLLPKPPPLLTESEWSEVRPVMAPSGTGWHVMEMS